MRVIFVSNYLPKSYLAIHEDIAKKVLSSAIQKFNGLTIDGLIVNGVNDLCLISYAPINSSICHKKVISRHESNEPCRSIVLKAINFPLIKNVHNYFSIKKEIKKQSNGRETVILLDALNPTSMIATIKAARQLKIKVVGIITDVNGIRAKITNEKHGLKSRLACKLGFKYQTRCDAYVFLTKQMNSLININNVPYRVVEGMSDSRTSIEELTYKKDRRIIMYAGSLHKVYGIPLLVKAFIECNFENTVLEIYGEGDYSSELTAFSKEHSNIIYEGMVDNETIVKREREVDLLVNPRPTNDNFTQYSFPSKTIEYMASGTPVLSSRLAGIPEEYFEYIIPLSEVSVDGIKKELKRLVSLSEEELKKIGIKAKNFVLTKKNNISQTKKIIELF